MFPEVARQSDPAIPAPCFRLDVLSTQDCGPDSYCQVGEDADTPATCRPTSASGHGPGCGLDAFPVKSSLSVKAVSRKGEQWLKSFLASCSMSQFDRDLKVGTIHDDVARLQRYIISQRSGPATDRLAKEITPDTKKFGPLTKSALAELQQKVGIKPAAGAFGPVTRAYVNRRHLPSLKVAVGQGSGRDRISMNPADATKLHDAARRAGLHVETRNPPRS